MSMIEKQINDLELLRDSVLLKDNRTAKNIVIDAIDTIKSLSEKLCVLNLKNGDFNEEKNKNEVCIWEESYNKTHSNTQCGHCVYTIHFYSKYSDKKYCPYCGKIIKCDIVKKGEIS